MVLKSAEYKYHSSVSFTFSEQHYENHCRVIAIILAMLFHQVFGSVHPKGSTHYCTALPQLVQTLNCFRGSAALSRELMK